MLDELKKALGPGYTAGDAGGGVFWVQPDPVVVNEAGKRLMVPLAITDPSYIEIGAIQAKAALSEALTPQHKQPLAG